MTNAIHSLRSGARKILPACGVLVILAALVPVPAAAGECEAECQPEETCSGGCHIDSDCGVFCEDGVCGSHPYTCAEKPPPSCDEPRIIINRECVDTGGGGPLCPPEQAPCLVLSPVPQDGVANWAIIEFHPDGLSVGPAQVLAESHPDVGSRSFQWLIRNESPPLHLTYPARQRFIWAQPAGRCAGVEAELLSRQTPFESPSGKSFFFFDVRINGGGRVVAIEPLYSDIPERIDEAALFLRENLVLVGRSKKPRALQVFVLVTVNEAGRAGYAIAGAGELL